MREIALAVLAVLLLIDWRQTLVIAKNPDKFHESWNLVLDKHPSVEAVHWWFGFCYALAVVVSIALWDYRELAWFAGFCAAVELAAVVHNHRLGIRP